jgi:hypothetical protein
MRTIAILMMAALALPAAEAGAAADRKALLDHLEKTSQKFQASVKGLSEAQWNFKAGPDRWSIAECAEHIAVSEDFIRGLVEQNLASPARAPQADATALDAKVLAMITNRTQKAEAPAPVRPKAQFAGGPGAVRHFLDSRAKTVALVKSRDDMRKHVSKHPVFIELDAHQWTLFLSGHTERHTLQIEEVKQQPGYPK